MEKITIYHNPDCSKSCAVLDILEENQTPFELVNYLQQTPTKEELEHLISLLGIRAFDLVRKGEQAFQLFDVEAEKPDSYWIDTMLQYPILIERPVVVKGNKALIGRPPILVKELF